jgi:hypothetical protein
LEIVQCRNERLQLEFFDIGAMVFFLRKVVWTVPDFTVDASSESRHQRRERCLTRTLELEAAGVGLT